jgi:hypothetical protein
MGGTDGEEGERTFSNGFFSIKHNTSFIFLKWSLVLETELI